MAYGTVKVDQITTSTQTLTIDNLATQSYVTSQGFVTSSGLSGTYANLASPAFTGDIELSAQAPIKFMDADSSHYVAFKAPATVAANVTWTLPATDAAGQLTSDGSGQLSWAAASGGGGASIGLALALG
tara:strand:- start:132 stop:518 length:387 start_codon:yes stop_codon:yes gene_type:complete